jgi:formyltetrahydrofolate-dependent phosphoribosylglycinamide formyltransferase
MAESHISTPEQVAALRDALAAEGKKLVFTNGCFDLLHAGHVRYLNEARALGDAMVIAMNSDDSVRVLKGPTRPVNNEEDRAEVLCGLRSVDAVCVFGEPRATRLIETIRPHIYAKGGDYTVESLNPEERAALEAAGADIRILQLVPGKSTTATIERMSLSEDQSKPGKLRIAVLGSGEGSNFRALLKSVQTGALSAEICCVISDVASSGILNQARAAGLTALHVNPGDHPLRFPEHAQKEVREHLLRARPDVVVLAGFMRILRAPVLEAFPERIINLHPSLLPQFKGSNAVQQALGARAAETGTSIHLVTEGVDEGRVLAQAKVAILPGDTVQSLHARIKVEEHKLLPQVLRSFLSPTKDRNPG